MGLFGDILRGLVKAICGSDEQQPAHGQAGYPGQKPTHAQQNQQQYPPLQHQQHEQKPHQQKPHHGHANGQVYTQGQTPSHPSSPPPHGRPHGDPNQVNQNNPEYVELRRRANEEGDAMGRAFDESQQAYKRGDRARAKELSEEGKRHQRQMESLHAQASAWIYRANNEDSRPGEIDLHGLYVKEAIEYTDRAIQEGLHSQNHVAKIKPAIEQLMQKHRLVAALDPNNEGVVIVQLGGGEDEVRQRGGTLLGADDISRRLGQKRDDGCLIM
ncbi:hypothetical protein OF83DRAFT_37123 [Amylostereum chailletii]|nr:hypothetical protein OF83DRAFT_37123 [Amylostereum chailletii]